MKVFTGWNFHGQQKPVVFCFVCFKSWRGSLSIHCSQVVKKLLQFMSHPGFPHTDMSYGFLKLSIKKCFTPHELPTDRKLELSFSVRNGSSMAQMRKPSSSSLHLLFRNRGRREPTRIALTALRNPPSSSSPDSPAVNSIPTSQVLGQSNFASLHHP